MVLVCIDSKQAAFEMDKYRLQNTYFCHPSTIICTVQRTWAVAEIKIKRMLDTMVLASSYHFIILTYRTTIDSRPQTVHIVRLHCRSRQLQEDGMQRILSEIETEHTQHGSNNYKSSIPVLICTYSIRHWSADVPNVDTLAVYTGGRKATEESRFTWCLVCFLWKMMWELVARSSCGVLALKVRT